MEQKVKNDGRRVAVAHTLSRQVESNCSSHYPETDVSALLGGGLACCKLEKTPKNKKYWTSADDSSI